VREEVELTRLLHRAVAGAVVAVFAAAGATPCLAGGTTPARAPSLTTLSAANQQVLKESAAVARQSQEPSSPSSPGTFFRSRKGALALALVAGAIGFTIWAQHDSRKDVKSAVR
jgi:hypothetical protein